MDLPKELRSAAVTSRGREGRRFGLRGSKRLLVAGIVLCGVVLIAVGLFLILSKPAEKIVLDPNMPKDYVLLTPSQVALRLKATTGLDIDELQQKELTESTFKDFDQAYEAAQALNGVKNYKASLVAYGIAEKKATKAIPYQFYQRYSGVSEIQNDTALTAKIGDKLKQAIQSDSSLSAARKQAMLHELDEKQRLKQLGY